MLGNDLFGVSHTCGRKPLNHTLSALNVLRCVRKLRRSDEGRRNAICFGRPHLIHFQLRTNTITERPGSPRQQVLAETTPLALDNGSDFSGRLHGAGHGRPTTVIEGESTASCGTAFVVHMISGAPSSSRRLRRLLRLITTVRVDFGSEVADHHQLNHRGAAPAE